MNNQIFAEDLFPLVAEQLNAGGSAVIPIRGVSMRPMLTEGISEVRLTKKDGIKKYDIILFKRESGEYVLHRVIKAGDVLICRGDNQLISEAVKRDAVIGTVSEYTKGNKWVSVNSFRHRLYAFFRVNTVWVRKLATRIHFMKK